MPLHLHTVFTPPGDAHTPFSHMLSNSLSFRCPRSSSYMQAGGRTGCSLWCKAVWWLWFFAERSSPAQMEAIDISLGSFLLSLLYSSRWLSACPHSEGCNTEKRRKIERCNVGEDSLEMRGEKKEATDGTKSSLHKRIRGENQTMIIAIIVLIYQET